VETNDVFLWGGGGHAKVVLESLFSEKRNVAGIFDDQKHGKLFGIPYAGQYNPDVARESGLIISLGDNASRKKLAESAMHPFTTTRHTSCVLSPRSSYGVGSMILHGAVVQSDTQIGSHVILNTVCSIDHDCKIGDFVHIGPRAVLCGKVHIGEGTLIGAGATVAPGVSIGKWSVIGAGSVVIANLPDYCVAVGNPARIIKTIPH
jgi:sugar O-acyltransferase (sialic acid O-acetyltransferase NeuD family)